MKKLILFASVLIGLTGCGSDESVQPEMPKQDVSFSLDFTFIESGSMGGRGGADAYTTFYNDYIKTKILTPKTYSLTFKNTDNGLTTTFAGHWGDNAMIKLPEGQYEVTGTSTPTAYTVDSLKMSFNETVTLSKQTSSVTLSAVNESYLLMFDATTIESVLYDRNVSYSGNKYLGKKAGNIIYLFMGHTTGGPYNNSHRLTISNLNGNTSTISDITKYPFEKGKWYYFDNISNDFNIPPMEEGK